MDSVAHTCRTCGRTPEQTTFRLNGSGFYRADCNECERTKQKARRQEWRNQSDDTPRVADGYAMMPYQGAVIAWDIDGGMVCLTDLHRATGSPEGKDPYRWLQQDGTKEYIEECCRQGLINTQDVNSLSRRGAHGGTWREKIIGLAYAQYLSAALYVSCNKFILEKWGQSRQSGVSDKLLQAIAAHLGILPRMEAKIDGLGGKLDDIGDKITNEPERWIGQNYIIEITNHHMIELLWRKFKHRPDDKPFLIAVGRTGPSGDVYELRLKDLLGKIDLEPGDYTILAHFGSPCPEDTETHTLNYPLAGCERLVLKNGRPSLTFIASDHQGVQAYKQLGLGKYYTLQTLERALPKPIVTPPPQTVNFMDIFGE